MNVMRLVDMLQEDDPGEIPLVQIIAKLAQLGLVIFAADRACFELTALSEEVLAEHEASANIVH
jgi:hypothetical protein